MLKIAIVSPSNKGKLYHRFQIPFNLLEGYDATVIDGFTVDHPASLYDVVIINQAFLQPLELLMEAKAKGTKIAWDVDDYIELPIWHDKYNPYTNKVYKQQQLETFKLADVVWCASKRLAEIFSSPKTYYVPNAIDYNQEQWRQPIAANRLDFVFAGGSTHYAHLMKVAKLFPARRTLLMGGYTKENDAIWDEMGKAFRGALHSFPNAEPYQYGQVYAHGKIAIAPLFDDHFNSCRSVLKALEAAAYNLPFVSDNKTTYGEVPMPNRDFKAVLRMLSNSQAAREEWGSRVREWADKNYNITTINQLRYETLKF
jgi:hypothetical protein